MIITFSKYQGTGNDFVLIDNREKFFDHSDIGLISRLCDRRFGIGADGLILIEKHETLDFRMIYFNSDGSKSLCGNGSRCAVEFAHSLGIIGEKTTFETTDGVHDAYRKNGWVYFQLHDILRPEGKEEVHFINTGSPHHIEFVPAVADIDVVGQGSKIRYSKSYAPAGTNVNFVELTPQGLKVRTYERGVEDETLSCGTGVTAAALAASYKGLKSPVTIQAPGGKLQVSFDLGEKNQFTNIYLAGPATKVYDGSIDI